MKLIALNIWGGEVNKPLLDFVKSYKDVDIFCFQEVLNETKKFEKSKTLVNAKNQDHQIYKKLQKILGSHISYFAQTQDDEGLALFINKNIKVVKTGDVFVHRFLNSYEKNKPETEGRNIQYAKISFNNQILYVVNFHGLWQWGGKVDSPERIIQSENIKKFLDNQSGAKILVGDFNLNPNTKSLEILEQDLENLVKKFNVKSTRTKFYPGVKSGETFADYILISKDVNVLDFKVLPDEVSDHSPLYLEFNL